MATSPKKSEEQNRKEIGEIGTRLKDLAVGVLKAISTDIPGFVGDVADKLAGDTKVLGEKDRSSQMFEAVTGIKPKNNLLEVIGSFASPQGVSGAMIVGASKMARAGKTSLEAIKEASSLIGEGYVPATKI